MLKRLSNLIKIVIVLTEVWRISNHYSGKMATKGEDCFPLQRANPSGSHLCVSHHSAGGSPGPPPNPGVWDHGQLSHWSPPAHHGGAEMDGHPTDVAMTKDPSCSSSHSTSIKKTFLRGQVYLNILYSQWIQRSPSRVWVIWSTKMYALK